jgi:hypothetical protein
MKTNGNNGALEKVGAKAGNRPEVVENSSQVDDVLINQCHKDGHIIRI